MLNSLKELLSTQTSKVMDGVKTNRANQLNNRAVDASLRVLVGLGLPEMLGNNRGIRQIVKFTLPLILTSIASRIEGADLKSGLIALSDHAQVSNGYKVATLVQREFKDLIVDVRQFNFIKDNNDA